MRQIQKVASGVVLATVLLAGCSAAPSSQPLAQDVDETSTGGPVDGCRPALTGQDPHPDDVDSEAQHPALDDTRLGDSVTGPVITAHTDVLAGVWSDHEAGELVVMVPGTDGMRVFERLRQDAPDPERVVCMEATYTRDELFLLANRVDERIAASDGPVPHRTHFDIARNRLQVEFESERDLAAATEVLGDLADDEGVHLAVAAAQARR